ncbi:hypothetical protein AVEN_205343-1 [Araneus ventricosus]|uniref:Uncharacterized protein n=1 Tax=Araneus ventricosus TaxID=182803 RepID=A0A4Y2QXG5_ARAVE|nr:hypothetical protein AVEN_205343-1 [Araneus ventricosus]
MNIGQLGVRETIHVDRIQLNADFVDFEDRIQHHLFISDHAFLSYYNYYVSYLSSKFAREVLEHPVYALQQKIFLLLVGYGLDDAMPL